MKELDTPLGKAYAKAKESVGPPPPPTPTPSPTPPNSSVGVFGKEENEDVITRRYKSAFIASKTGGKGYIQYDKATNKLRYQIEIPNTKGKPEQIYTPWMGPTENLTSKIMATLGRAISKLGQGKELTDDEKQELSAAAIAVGETMMAFEKSIKNSQA